MTSVSDRAIQAARNFAKTWDMAWIETAVVVDAEKLEGRLIWAIGVFEPDLDIELSPESYWTHIPTNITYYVDQANPIHIGYSIGRGVHWLPVTGPTEPRKYIEPPTS